MTDIGGHGTRVAGIIGALKNDWGTHGVAYNANLLSIRAAAENSCAAGGCSFFDKDIIAAIDYAVANGAQIINLSLGARQILRFGFRYAETGKANTPYSLRESGLFSPLGSDSRQGYDAIKDGSPDG